MMEGSRRQRHQVISSRVYGRLFLQSSESDSTERPVLTSLTVFAVAFIPLA